MKSDSVSLHLIQLYMCLFCPTILTLLVEASICGNLLDDDCEIKSRYEASLIRGKIPTDL